MSIISDIPTIQLDDSECLLYTGNLFSNGYPAIIQNKQIKRIARVLIEEKEERKLNRSEIVFNTCLNPQCLNIEHLIVGKQRDNPLFQDSKRKVRTAKRQAIPSENEDNNIEKFDNFDYSTLTK